MTTRTTKQLVTMRRIEHLLVPLPRPTGSDCSKVGGGWAELQAAMGYHAPFHSGMTIKSYYILS